MSASIPDAPCLGGSDRPVAVDRELERGLRLKVRVPVRRGLEVHDDKAALRATLQEVERLRTM